MDLLFGLNCHICAKSPSDGTLEFLSFWAVVPQVTSPAACVTKACSDGTQPVCSSEACSMEAFQLLQQDLTKISCSLLNYNLLSAFFFPPSLFQKRLPLCFAANWFVYLCVCVCHMHACVKLPQLLAVEALRWLAGHASEVGQRRAQELRLLLLFGPFVSSSWLLAVSTTVMTFTGLSISLWQHDPCSKNGKLCNPSIGRVYERSFLGFSLLNARSSYVQPGPFFQAWQQRMEQLMVCDCSGFSCLI